MAAPVPPIQGFPKPILPFPEDSAHACKVFQYAVKTVCGRSPVVPEANQNIVAPGQYFTAINIHNPANCKTVTFRWRVVVANRFGDPVGLISTPQKVTLRPAQGVEIDTPDILRVTQAVFSKGFVIIESPCELDIVAVYSAAPPQAAGQPLGALVAFHTERVPARQVEACREDLTLDLSTGVAEWTLTSAVNLANVPLPLTTPRPAAAMEDPDRLSGWATQAGTKWLSVNAFANVPNLTKPGFVPGFYTFQTCFALCAGFEGASLDLKLLNDDDIVVWLNNTQINSFASNLGGPPTPVPLITSGFLPGVNCLSIVVRNNANTSNPNPVGLNAKAILKAARGVCPDCGCGCQDEKLAYPAKPLSLPTDPQP